MIKESYQISLLQSTFGKLMLCFIPFSIYLRVSSIIFSFNIFYTHAIEDPDVT